MAPVFSSLEALADKGSFQLISMVGAQVESGTILARESHKGLLGSTGSGIAARL
jgi:hypothetical protein